MSLWVVLSLSLYIVGNLIMILPALMREGGLGTCTFPSRRSRQLRANANG